MSDKNSCDVTLIMCTFQTGKGLVNGAFGVITGIDVDERGSVSQIRVKFDHMQESVVINKVQADYELYKNVYVTRSQFPLRLAYGVSTMSSKPICIFHTFCFFR